jgi:hypothetical protein
MHGTVYIDIEFFYLFDDTDGSSDCIVANAEVFSE